MPFSIKPEPFEWFPEGAWIVALHQFIEVSVGIIVALLVVAIWPERSPIAAKKCGSISRSGGALSKRFETRIVTQGIKHGIEFE